jgi:CcmD family protein
MTKNLLLALVLTLPLQSFVLASGVQTPQPPAHEGFVPVDQLPGQEQLPAAPLVAAAYGVAWAVVLLYVWSLWRRLARVERELADVARRIESGAGP